LTEQALAEIWNGTKWSVMPSPAGSEDIVDAVSCVSSAKCVAVGSSSDYGLTEQELVEIWNGTTWSIATGPETSGSLSDVSCVSWRGCVAVGDTGSSQHAVGAKTLIEAWDGTAWTITASVSPGSENNALNGVSCVGRMGCVAVGNYRKTNQVTSYNAIETMTNQWWPPCRDRGSPVPRSDVPPSPRTANVRSRQTTKKPSPVTLSADLGPVVRTYQGSSGGGTGTPRSSDGLAANSPAPERRGPSPSVSRRPDDYRGGR
jgi:hypothetical protein